MKARKFKVMESLATHKGAHLRFRGEWVRKAGFEPGKVIEVRNPSPGVLELRVVESLPASAGFAEAKAAFERMGI